MASICRREFVGAGLALGLWPSWLRALSSPLRLVYFDNYAPFSYLEQHQMHGILVDILDGLLGQTLHQPLKHEGFPWRRAQILVEAGEADGFFTVPTKLRQQYAEFTVNPLYRARAAIAFKRHHRSAPALDRVRSLDELRSFLHGNYLGNGWATQYLEGMRVEWSPTLINVLNKLANERGVEVCIDNFPALYYSVKQQKLDRTLVVKPLPAMGFPFTLHLGLRRSLLESAELLRAVDALADQPATHALVRAVHTRYLGNDPLVMEGIG